VVFSRTEEVGRDNGHGEDITGGSPSVIGTSTDVSDVRGNTGATQGESKTEPWEKVEDVTLRGLDGVLIRCKDMAST